MRLQALGRVHDLLASGRSYATEMNSLVAEVLKPYQDEGETRVKVTGASIVLPPNTAIMLSVLFNELATNATKYGALSLPSGQVAHRVEQPQLLRLQLAPIGAGDVQHA